MVARAGGEDPDLVVREAAPALAAVAHDPRALVTACRRLVEGHPTSAPVWWLTARVLAAADPSAEAWASARAIASDPTGDALAEALPGAVRVTVLGWSGQVAPALLWRGDVTTLVVDALGSGSDLVFELERAGNEAVLVGEAGLAAAVRASDLVLLDAAALGPGGMVAVAGSLAAAAVARHVGVPVWAVAGTGRVLPAPLWDALAARWAQTPEPWHRPEDVVALDLVDVVVGPAGREAPGEADTRSDCPPVPELTRR